uniref:Uncharacterized protein n=1 Tax=Parascaris univalens TaxID=6257 RepID=A0A915C438_PARUN
FTPSLSLLFILFSYCFICSFACFSTGVGNSCYCFNGQLCEQCSTGHISYGGHYSPTFPNGYAAPAGYDKPTANHHKYSSRLYKETSARPGTPLSLVNGYEQSNAFIQQRPFSPHNDALLPATNIQSIRRIQNLTPQLKYVPVNEYKTAVSEENVVEQDPLDSTLKTAAAASTNKHRLLLHQVDSNTRNKFAGQGHINQKILNSVPLRSTAIEDVQQLRESTITHFIHVQPIPLSYQANPPNRFPSESDTEPATGSQYLESNAMPNLSSTILPTRKSIMNQWSSSVGTQKSSPYSVTIVDGEQGDSHRTSYSSTERMQSYYSENEYSYESDAYTDDLQTNTANVSLSRSEIWSPKSSIYAQNNNHITEDDDRTAPIIPNQQNISFVSSIAPTFRPFVTKTAQSVRRPSVGHETIQPSSTSSDYPREYSSTASFNHDSTMDGYKSSTPIYITFQQQTPFLEESRKTTEITEVITPESNDEDNSIYNYKPYASRNSFQQISVNYENSPVKFTIDTSTSHQMPATTVIATEQLSYSFTPFSKHDIDLSSFHHGNLQSWQSGNGMPVQQMESSTAEAIFVPESHETSTVSQKITTNITHGQDLHQQFSMVNSSNSGSVLNHESLHDFENSGRKRSKERVSYHFTTINSTSQQLSTTSRVDEELNYELITTAHRWPMGFGHSDRRQNVSLSLSSEGNAVNDSDRENSKTAPEITSSNKSLNIIQVHGSSETTVAPHTHAEEPTALSSTNERTVVSTAQEPNIMTAFLSNSPTTSRQSAPPVHFSRTTSIKPKPMTNEKVDLIQKVDHRTDDRAAKGND